MGIGESRRATQKTARKPVQRRNAGSRSRLPSSPYPCPFPRRQRPPNNLEAPGMPTKASHRAKLWQRQTGDILIGRLQAEVAERSLTEKSLALLVERLENRPITRLQQR